MKREPIGAFPAHEMNSQCDGFVDEYLFCAIHLDRVAYVGNVWSLRVNSPPDEIHSGAIGISMQAGDCRRNRIDPLLLA